MFSPCFRDLLKQFRFAADEDQLFATLDKGTWMLGFEQFALGHHVDLGRPPEQAIRLTSYHPDWVDEAVGRAYFVDDPIHEASVHFASAFSWRRISEQIDVTNRQRRTMYRAERFGLAEGITVPVHMPGDFRGTCSFAGRSTVKSTEDAEAMADVIGRHAFEAARRIMRKRARAGERFGKLPKLTRRQVEVLVFLGRGKTDPEIAAILKISEFTAHEHVEKIRLAYGGAQRTFLIGRALFDGHLSYEEILA